MSSRPHTPAEIRYYTHSHSSLWFQAQLHRYSPDPPSAGAQALSLPLFLLGMEGNRHSPADTPPMLPCGPHALLRLISSVSEVLQDLAQPTFPASCPYMFHTHPISPPPHQPCSSDLFTGLTPLFLPSPGGYPFLQEALLDALLCAPPWDVFTLVTLPQAWGGRREGHRDLCGRRACLVLLCQVLHFWS